MPKGATLPRLQRLDRLRGLLTAGEQATIGELAIELGVSTRSLHRDLDILRESGLRIDSDRGRGGGIRMHPNWASQRIQLTVTETVDLLLAIALAERLGSSLLLGELKSVRQKLSAAFPLAHRDRINSLRKRILVGDFASPAVAVGYNNSRPQASAIKQAFFDQRHLYIAYADQNRKTSERMIEPQFLYLNAPAWYLLAWDGLREDVRFFRLDRIRAAEMLGTRFRLRDRNVFLAHAEKTAAFL